MRRNPAGLVCAGIWEIKEAFAVSAGNRSLPKTDGFALPAVWLTKGNSVQTAEQKNRPKLRYINATSVAGNRKTQKILLNFALNAETLLMKAI
ncbi:hypothetical protein SDC9_197289 [bioreactor metagenome]|uniref:Uncharacterized protein n=1 Tax=bioreactor metagenome TaxID=1076179 RepID=A0A645IEH7_9ZZZZ